MNWTDAITRVIELQTFASVWYWMAVIVTWSVASNWLIGIPFDVLFRARKFREPALSDLVTLVDINVRRIVDANRVLGTAITGLIAFCLSGLAMMGFYYEWEIAQGLFILAAPLTLIVFINMRVAEKLHATPMNGHELVRYLFVVRLWTQVIAMVTMFFTAMYGIYYTLSAQVVF